MQMWQSMDLRAAAENRMNVRGFYTRFSAVQNRNRLPESLTLFYLPRISQISFLEINGSMIRPEKPAFLTLHRVVSSSSEGSERGCGCVTYGCRDRVGAAEGVRFEVYVGEEKALKGVFRRDQYGAWAMECSCALVTPTDFACGEEAEVFVAAEGEAATMVQRVGMAAPEKRRGRRFCGLEKIPEEPEEENECEGWRSWSLGQGDTVAAADGGEEWMKEWDVEVNVEGVGWAVDVGLWVVCVGVGILVSKASAPTLRKLPLL